MDHKVSKDMISSGMIPSGEKTQADLGRTQYGSAPSPSKLMDAYKSMYDNKEEVINEMAGKGMGMTPAPKPNAGGIAKPKPPLPTPVEKDSSSPAPKTDSRMDQVKKQGFAKSYRKVGPKSETEDMLDKVKDRQVEKAVNRDKDVRRARASYIMTKYGESVDLLAAYRSVYEHHKKDADGNTIPHEDEEVNEGKIPAGLQAYLDKKKGKKEDKKEMKEGMGLYANIHAKRKRGGKMRKKGDAGAPSSQDFANAAKTAKEDVDKFDVVFNHFINEGHSEKEAYSKMTNLTEEQLDEFMKMLAAKAAQYGANLGQKTKIDAVGGIKRKPFEPVAQRKPFDAKPKPGEQGFKAKSASEVISSVHASRRKPEPITQKKEEPKVTPIPIRRRKKEVMQDEYQYVNEIAQFIPMLAKGAAAVGKALKPVVSAAKTVKKTVGKVVRDPTVQNLATQTAVGAAMNSGGGPQKQRADKVSAGSYQAASADLFDIVKGQLLDEGLSEEEIKDIMLTLTPDEIMEELSDIVKRNDAINKANAMKRAKEREVPQNIRDASKRQMKAGTPREDPKNPYTTQDKKDIINYNKNKESM